MRLLVVSQYFWPENFRINDLVSALVDRGHEVTILTGLPNYPEGRVFPDFKRNPEHFESFHKARILRVPIVPRGCGSLRLVLNYLSFVISGLIIGSWKLRRLQFDAIFVVQLSPITSALPALWFKRIKKTPLLMWVLDLWPESISAVGAVKSPRVLNWIGRLVSFIYNRCDRILVQSQAFLPNVTHYSEDSYRIRYFPGWAEPIFQGSSFEISPASEVTPYIDTFNIVFAGNIGDAQDFPAILEAVEVLKDRTDIRWLILGDGRAAQWVRSEIQKRGLNDSIVMLGRHPIDQMPSFFVAASALLVTLKCDPIFSLTIPGKVQSYLATGLPLLGMLDGEGARIISESGAGLVCPAGEGRELAKLVCRLVEMHRDDRDALGKRGQDYCSKHFDRSTLISSFELWVSELDVAPGRK